MYTMIFNTHSLPDLNLCLDKNIYFICDSVASSRQQSVQVLALLCEKEA